MNIGQAAKRAGLPTKTIRYYEDIDLINPARDANGYRSFSEDDLHKLAFLARARSLGFTIDDCRALIALHEDNSRASADVKRIAEDHLSQIDAKLQELTQMRTALAHLVDRCAGDDHPDCQILKDLAQGTGL